MKGFVVYPAYEVIDNKSYVFLYGRLENGDSFLTINESKPYFYIKKNDLDAALKLVDFEHEDCNMKNFKGKTVVKIIINIPADVAKLRKRLEAHKIECYEADIRFPYRFMFDNGIQGSLEINGDFEGGERVDRVYKEPDIKPAEYKPNNLKVLSFDVEAADPDDGELYCISVVCDKTNKVFMNTRRKLKNTISCENEKEVLENFVDEVVKLDPDVITGWNVIDFDLDFLAKKCRKYKIPFRIGRDLNNIKLRIEENFFRDSKADVSGRQVIDALQLMKVSFIKVRDYKLNTVASEILGDKKLIETEGFEKYKEIDELFIKDQQKLADYNLKDSELVIRIIDKTKILDLSISRSLLTVMPLDRVNASIASFDSLYIREANQRGIVVPSGKYEEKEERLKGGYVKESIPGIYDNILVLDFKGLYPSIMRTFNIDPYSYVPDCKGKNLIKAPNGACFRNEHGILPTILEKLYHEREKTRKTKDELTRYAIKILSNSFFGLMGNPACRFYDINMTNAITHFAQYIIQLTAKESEKLGYKWIYSDTDSVFLVSKAKSSAEAEKIGKKIEEHINQFYKKLVKKEYNRESYLELEYDKCYIKCLMPKLRGKEEGAKKRYAGLIKKDGKEEIEFTGLEAVRGDWTELAKKYQHELLDRIFHDREVVKFTRKFVEDIKGGKYDKLLIYKKSIRKDLKGYVKITPPHVKAARKLKKLEGNRIEYVLTTDGPEPIGFQKHKIDYNHYIDKQIKPIADSVLVFFNIDFDSLINGSKQLDLSSF